ncbi:hypothetical protein [Streptomyces odontomachi]|uniref:hypothetical protein n=1 Tax=Streptomyces odontomachi TaxID=2944940 RepID=UPI00210AD06F|nr:hypothetical protein [Streptomyces sp. ODS25]
MISINTGSISTKLDDRSIAVSCLLGTSPLGTGLSGIPAVRSASSMSLAGLGVRERNLRPTLAPEAVAKAETTVYAFAAAGAGYPKQTQQHHTMWAFRGLEPWRDPA